MKLLLDTHVLMWWLAAPERLSTDALAALSSGRALVWSVASTWELAIKVALGRLELAAPLPQFLSKVVKDERLEVLPIHQSHALAVAELPKHHRDPFDRILVAQALVEKLHIVSSDRTLERYGVRLVW